MTTCSGNGSFDNAFARLTIVPEVKVRPLELLRYRFVLLLVRLTHIARKTATWVPILFSVALGQH